MLKDDYAKWTAIPQTSRSFSFEILTPQSCHLLSNHDIPQQEISFVATSNPLTIGTRCQTRISMKLPSHGRWGSTNAQ